MLGEGLAARSSVLGEGGKDEAQTEIGRDGVVKDSITLIIDGKKYTYWVGDSKEEKYPGEDGGVDDFTV